MDRIDKIISSQSANGRKEARRLIKNGAVRINGEVCCKPDFKVDVKKDKIEVNGTALIYDEFVYIMMNKPAGVVSATEDKHDKTVIDLIPDKMKRKGLFPAGRLDKDTEGLLIITDDGDFAHRMLSPKKNVYKKYIARLDAEITDKTIQSFKDGIVFADGTKCLPAFLERHKDAKNTAIVTICEGKFHQVKKMFAVCGLNVVHLQRISIGNLYLDSNLPIGCCKFLTNLDKELIFMGNIY